MSDDSEKGERKETVIPLATTANGAEIAGAQATVSSLVEILERMGPSPTIVEQITGRAPNLLAARMVAQRLGSAIAEAARSFPTNAFLGSFAKSVRT